MINNTSGMTHKDKGKKNIDDKKPEELLTGQLDPNK